MTVDDREHAGTDGSPRPLPSEQATIPQTGDVGVVETQGGVTSLGTTPIGLGSVGPVQQHQRATELIMGETDTAEGAATAAGTDDQGVQAQAASRPVGGFDYTGADCQAWLREAGFRATRVAPLAGPDAMVIGIK